MEAEDTGLREAILRATGTYELTYTCSNCEHKGNHIFNKGTAAPLIMECEKCGCNSARKPGTIIDQKDFPNPIDRRYPWNPIDRPHPQRLPWLQELKEYRRCSPLEGIWRKAIEHAEAVV